MPPTPNVQSQKSLALYNAAADILHTGKKVIADDNSDGYGMLGCAETVNAIAKIAWGYPIGGGLSTFAMWKCLKDPTKFSQILPKNALAGDIIISPTNAVPHPRLSHGHVGIVAEFGVLSNSSETGMLAENWTVDQWISYFTTYGGLPTLLYRAL
jgi:hypothetical protein